MTQSAPFSIGRYEHADGARFTALVIDDKAVPLDAASAAFSPQTTLDDLLCDWSAQFASLKQAAHEFPSYHAGFPLSQLKPLSPLARPRQIFCTGANYGRHVVEMMVAVGLGPTTEGMTETEKRAFGEDYVARQKREAHPYVFMVPVTALAGPQDDLVLPDYSDRMDWELELGVVLGAEAHRVARGEAMKCVAGFVLVNDITARDKVRRADPGAIGPDWIAAKGGPGFKPVGPLFTPAEFMPDIYNLRLRLRVNGEIMQDDSTSDMTFGVERQIEHISAYARMLPGDLLCTGSPAGNGVARGLFLKPGDCIEAEAEGLGRQSVRCVAPPNKTAAQS